jgi:leucyl/phenylalanyl-tRNA--protein transferase
VTLQLPWLSEESLDFPPLESALTEPNGLIAVGGDLSVPRLLSAYRHGIFPWYETDAQPIFWWSPHPRSVLFLDALKVNRTLAKRLRNHEFHITTDQSFLEVVKGCSQPRKKQKGTWITPQMQDAYFALHQEGLAHSVEVWEAKKCVGGLYGVSLGKIFYGESMFSAAKDASKIALVHLVGFLKEHGFKLIDCQVHNPYLGSMGAREIPREEFQRYLRENLGEETERGVWTFRTYGY